MKVLIINGSPHRNGHSDRVVSILSEVFCADGIEVRLHRAEDFLPSGCRACGGCRGGGGCVLGDIHSLCEDFRRASGMVVTSPVYYGSPSGTVISLLDRLFQSSKFDKRMKVGAAFVTARRGGCTASFDALNKYFSISEMPIASSNYWNLMHTSEDKEGELTAKKLAENMAFLMKSIELGKEKFGL